MTLEQLFNKLIDMGWEPFGRTGEEWDSERSLNDICSIESGLWQFVCDKGLYSETDHPYNSMRERRDHVGDIQRRVDIYDYNYFVILSALREDKEKFLLENIKIPL